MYCENCGTSVEAGSKFCSACGNNIDADAQAPRTSQSNFVSEGRRSSSQNLQTIILISVPALLLVTIAAWLLIPSAFHIGDHLSPSDSNIKSLLEAEWNKSSRTVPLGNFVVLGGPFGSPNVDASKGTISTNTYNELIAWQKLGLVTVRNDQQYENFRSGRNFSWDQWTELTQKHVQMKIVVTATQRGRQYLKSGSMDKLEIPWGNFRITTIVKNEEHKKGVDEYRLIMANYDAQWSPEFKAFSELMGNKLYEKRKVIELLKFDAFESKWKQYTWDAANANEEFKTNNVAHALASK